MRSTTPTIHCDACDVAWTIDYWASSVTSVGGVLVTATERAPGWGVTPDGDDLCPDCYLGPS